MPVTFHQSMLNEISVDHVYEIHSVPQREVQSIERTVNVVSTPVEQSFCANKNIKQKLSKEMNNECNWDINLLCCVR